MICRKKILIGAGAAAALLAAAAAAFFGWGAYQRAQAAKEAGIWRAGSHWGEALKNNAAASGGEQLAQKMISLQKEHFTPENRVFCAIIPDKGYYLQQEGAPETDYSALLDAVRSGLSDSGIHWIDLTGALSADQYFTTDSHWKQESLQPVLDTLGSAMDFSIELKGFVPHPVDGFAGAYGKYGAKPQDTLIYHTSDATEAAVVSDFQHPNSRSVYDPQRLSTDVPYDVFLSGATPLVTITSPHAKTDRELILFRDSFGSSLAPLLLEEYRTVTLVDLRYMMSALLPQYVEFTNQDVLFLYSTLVADQSRILR